jgi:hypothetical protein
LRKRENSQARPKSAKPNNGANLGFEEKLWAAADTLRGHMDASEYKHVVLGLIFLKYISDAFQEQYEAIQQQEFADPEDRDEYTAANVFWVPEDARWRAIMEQARSPRIGNIIDDAMAAIERDNERLRGVLPRNYGRPDLDKQSLATYSAASTSTSSASSPGPRASGAASSTPPAASSASSSRCSSPSTAASTTPAAAPGACSSRAPSS